jgi:hypothetical protein
MQRLEALEREDHQAFAGYAVLDLYDDQTIDQAKAEWIAENGPVGNRQWVVYHFGARARQCG